jgi:hypothetical protein
MRAHLQFTSAQEQEQAQAHACHMRMTIPVYVVRLKVVRSVHLLIQKCANDCRRIANIPPKGCI